VFSSRYGLKYYLDELRLQRVREIKMSLTTLCYTKHDTDIVHRRRFFWNTEATCSCSFGTLRTSRFRSQQLFLTDMYSCLDWDSKPYCSGQEPDLEAYGVCDRSSAMRPSLILSCFLRICLQNVAFLSDVSSPPFVPRELRYILFTYVMSLMSV
jgi:hypothetical protein